MNDKIYKAIESDKLNISNNIPVSISNHLTMIDYLVSQTKKHLYENNKKYALANMRKIAAICIRCMREHDIVTQEEEGTLQINDMVKENDNLRNKIKNWFKLS